MLRFIILFCGFTSTALYAEIIITDATVRLLPIGVPNTVAYFAVRNNSDEEQVLIGASSDFATKTEIHNHVMRDGMMSMQKQDEVVIKPHQSVQFSPGGLHIMLFGVKPLQENQLVSINLQTKKGESIPFTAKVTRPSTHAHH